MSLHFLYLLLEHFNKIKYELLSSLSDNLIVGVLDFRQRLSPGHEHWVKVLGKITDSHNSTLTSIITAIRGVIIFMITTYMHYHSRIKRGTLVPETSS